MSDRLKGSLKRLERLSHIRQTYVSVAEAGVKQAEGEVRRLENADAEAVGHIQHTQAEIAYLQTATGSDIQNGEKYIQAMKEQRKVLQQSLETATTNLVQRRSEWTEAMKEQKIIEKLQERRLHLSERADDIEMQKAQDEAFIARHVRERNRD
ncbi:MAG TPA: flagellar FliJ family protein [Terriglobia bacterium]|nr:flagellar FliJ family protein [Terriglobia bacterium]